MTCSARNGLIDSVVRRADYKREWGAAEGWEHRLRRSLFQDREIPAHISWIKQMTRSEKLRPS